MSATKKTVDGLCAQFGIDGITPEAVVRFVNDTINRRPVEPADAMQTAVMLGGLMQGVRAGDDMGKELRHLFKAGKAYKKKFDPANAFIGSTESKNEVAWDIVWQLEIKKITRQEALDAFCKHVAEADEKTIDGWIKAIRPSVRNVKKLRDAAIGKS